MNNNRVKTLKIQIEYLATKYNSQECYSFEKELNDNILDFQEIKIPDECNKKISRIILIIKSVYKGLKYNDTCISAIQFENNNQKFRINEIVSEISGKPFNQTLGEKQFFQTINPTCGSWAELISLDKENEFENSSTNGFLIFDRKFCYINDNLNKGVKNKLNYKYCNASLEVGINQAKIK